jgi:molybdopterin synthase catalytic subunit
MISVQHEDFNIGVEYEKLRISSQSPGAIVTFAGLVRQIYNKESKGDIVQSLYLEHYPGMTEQKLNAIEEQARSKWDLLGSKIIHRVGKLSADDQIVFVGVASSHREDAFLAAQYIMDFLKNEAPFWKKQKTQHGNEWISSRKSDLVAINKWK